MPLKSHSPKLNFKTKKIDLIFLMTNWINDQTLQVYKEHKKLKLLCSQILASLFFLISDFPSPPSHLEAMLMTTLTLLSHSALSVSGKWT